MPLSESVSFAYAIDPDAGLALAGMAGVLTGADMREIVATVHADPRWRDDFDAIWDCSRVLAHVVLPEDVLPLVIAVVHGETGRDVMIESKGYADQAITQLLALRCRRAGKAVGTRATLGEALDTLGYDGLPEALKAVGTALLA